MKNRVLISIYYSILIASKVTQMIVVHETVKNPSAEIILILGWLHL